MNMSWTPKEKGPCATSFRFSADFLYVMKTIFSISMLRGSTFQARNSVPKL